MKHCTVIPIKDQKTMYVGGVKSAYRVLNTCCDSQNDTIGKIELNPSNVLSSEKTNCKNDIQ